jgi:hypothetical protein
MMTREFLLREMRRSEADEERTYKELTLGLFRELQAPLKRLYDEAVAATADFMALTPQAVQDNPKIVKVLRYCLAPVISQMRLGQILELDSTEGFEERAERPTDAQAARLAQWFTDYLDRERFPWAAHSAGPLTEAERRIAGHYAKLCTVALVSNQNTATRYRNLRKERQERAIAGALEALGLRPQERLGLPPTRRPRRKKGEPPPPRAPRRPGGIDSIDDVQPGHYVKEKKILARSEKRQKADLTVRPESVEALYCIEAKAVGIRIDSTKRLKELNDKFTDWTKSTLPITTVGVCAGFFNDLELIATIRGRGIPLFFEHDLARLTSFLRTRTYYDAAWNPAALFPEVPVEAVRATLEKIQTAPVEAGDAEPSGNG